MSHHSDQTSTAVDRLLLDIGGTKLIVATADRTHIVDRIRIDEGGWTSSEGLISEVVAAAETLRSGSAANRTSKVVAAVPGLLDRPSGVVLTASNLPFRNFPLRDALQESFPHSEVILVPDRTCGAVGEAAWGAARGTRDSVYITLSTGIGMGVIAENRPVFGAHGWAGELGHMPIRLGGKLCACGERGCLEAYASGRGIASSAGEVLREGGAHHLRAALGDKGNPTARDVIAAAEAGDQDCMLLVQQGIDHIVLGLTMVCRILDPQVIVLGGGLTRSDAFMTWLMTAIESTGDSRLTAKVSLGALGEDAVLLGSLELSR